MIRDSGASEVHLRIASSCAASLQIRHRYQKRRDSCRSPNDCLLNLQKDRADSLEYLSEENLIAAIGLPEDQICTACFTGKYLDENDLKAGRDLG